MINNKNFDPDLLSIDQVSFKKSTDCVIYYIEYFKDLDSSNSLYLVFNNVGAYIVKNNKNKYLIFASTDKNKETLENYTEWDETKYQIELISGSKPIKYEKDSMKIRFESDDKLPLAKILTIPVCIIVARSVFRDSSNYYPQACLHECLYECEYEYEDDSYSIV